LPGEYSHYSYSLRAEQSGDLIPMWAKFSVSVQTDSGPTQPPVQWVPGLFPEVKRQGRGANHTSTSST